MPKQKKTEAKSEPKKPSRTPELGKKTALAKGKFAAITKIEAKASTAKPVLLKLPRTLKKAARACAKAQGLKLRAWIVETIKIRVADDATAKPLQTL